ncbi:limbin [Poecilia formosa]|uniref:EvC ciliary complex subunit 2 n=1 Tax=Poecilia formosa TaxID=48698 RepID=A0A087XL09_POEFO|nr:PREDICTED: limbin [Poecilia formosa]
MFRVHLIAQRRTLCSFFLHIKVLCLFSHFLNVGCGHDVKLCAGVTEDNDEHYCYNGTSVGTKWDTTPLTSGKYGNLCTLHAKHQDQGGTSAGLTMLRINGKMDSGLLSVYGWGPSSSSAPLGPWGHSIYSSFSYVSNMLHLRKSRSTLIRHTPHQPPPQVQNVAPPSFFEVRFYKCAQVKPDTDPPQLTFFLQIHNLSPLGGTNLSQVAVRDSISGIKPIKTEGRVVERGYQTFTIDSLLAGSHVVVNYTAHIRSHKNELLDLPAFLTFSNASQNDVSMFGPQRANLTLTVNSTDRIYPNHGVHFAGFVAGVFITLVLLLLGVLAIKFTSSRERFCLFQQKRIRCHLDPEYAESGMSDSIKDEAAFEDKMVDVMVLEDPQNMYQALDNLETSSLLQASSNLEATRIQMYKDLMSCLLGGLRSRAQISAQAQQRLLSVVHGQLLGMEGRLKEERGARMAALAGRCNLETHEEMEAEHQEQEAEKAQAERLRQHADQQEFLQCSRLLEKLHKQSQSHLRRVLLVRHEDGSAKVQREIIEWRRVELHKIFSEELEEATRMGELEKSTAKRLQHEYFACQDQLEEVLDVVVANQRYVLAERSAQRKFLVHSLHSLEDLISETFSSASSNLDSWFSHIKRGSAVPSEQLDQLQEKAQKDVVMVRQRLDETLNQEKRAMRCGLINKRRELISNMLRVHKQRQRDLSSITKSLEEKMDETHHLQCWQNLLTAHSLELAELINSLDEEAAADIRKVTMRGIQGVMADVKAIQPAAAQAVLTLLPLGAKHPVLQVEPEAGPGKSAGQGGGALLQGQERLHQEGKAALRTLSCTRQSLQEGMEQELREQKELRAHWRDFFRCLCSSQLTLSEDDRLRMKLEFQKSLSVIDRCLVLPHAVSRTKLHAALAEWRAKSEEEMENMQSKGKSTEARRKADTSEVVRFQKRLQDRIDLFEKERQMENSVMNKVMEEMQREREDYLLCQADNLAMQMATIVFQKAERWTRVLETSKAMVTLQSQLIQQLRERNISELQDVAQSIHSHCLSLEEPEQQLQSERTELDRLGVPSHKIQTVFEGEEGREEDEVFELQPDCSMTSILQDALHKCEQVIALTFERFQEISTSNQVKEELKEQIELKRLYSNCDQDLEFASQLVKQSRVSDDVLLEVLRLLLPSLPESELLSLGDALCRKRRPVSAFAEQERSGCAGEQNRAIPVRLREIAVRKTIVNTPNGAVERERLEEKRRSAVEKLLPRSHLLRPRDAGLSSLTDNRGAQDVLTPAALVPQLQSDTAEETAHGPAGESVTSDSVCGAAGSLATGERLFVFRDPPESSNSVVIPERKKKRNFLNFKKGSVAPAT